MDSHEVLIELVAPCITGELMTVYQECFITGSSIIQSLQPHHVTKLYYRVMWQDHACTISKKNWLATKRNINMHIFNAAPHRNVFSSVASSKHKRHKFKNQAPLHVIPGRLTMCLGALKYSFLQSGAAYAGCSESQKASLHNAVY